MPKTDLSGRQRLLIYELLQELETETNKPLVDWLHLIACAADSNNSSEHKLTLRPNKNWGIRKSRKEKIFSRQRPSWTDEFLSSPNPRRYAGSRLVYYRVDWSFEESVLTYFKNEPQSIKEPNGLAGSFREEGIEIYREDFRTWWKTSEYGPLPHFWFSEKEQKSPIVSELSTTKQVKTTSTKKQKKGPLAGEIDYLLNQGVEFSTEALWTALVFNAGKPGGSIITIKETEVGPVLLYRTATQNFKKLTKKALAARLYRLAKKQL